MWARASMKKKRSTGWKSEGLCNWRDFRESCLSTCSYSFVSIMHTKVVDGREKPFAMPGPGRDRRREASPTGRAGDLPAGSPVEGLPHPDRLVEEALQLLPPLPPDIDEVIRPEEAGLQLPV
jgi:hypothetical protein